MNLPEWTTKGYFKRHRTSRKEIAELLAIADRDLADSTVTELSHDARLSFAYNAGLQLAHAALAASGLRTAAKKGHHYWTIQSLSHTIEADPAIVKQLDKFRGKRNTAEYERAYAITEKEAEEMGSLARQLRILVVDWLRDRHPTLLGK